MAARGRWFLVVAAAAVVASAAAGAEPPLPPPEAPGALSPPLPAGEAGRREGHPPTATEAPPPEERGGGGGRSSGRWLAPQEVSGACAGSPATTARVAVYLPAGYPGGGGWPLVIALHGWGHEAGRWKDLGLGDLADRHGLVVVAPEMATSVYERAFYPETSRRWGGAPGACWITEVVLPFARRTLSVDGSAARTAVLGYSTGGRGALVVAARSRAFAFAGSISGTYDLAALDERTGEYRIHAQVFGARSAHAGRWRGEEIPLAGPGLAATRIWLAHGAADPVVPAAQQDRLRDALAGRHPALQAFLVAGGGHDDTLWRAQLVPLVEALAATVRAGPARAPAPLTP